MLLHVLLRVLLHVLLLRLRRSAERRAHVVCVAGNRRGVHWVAHSTLAAATGNLKDACATLRRRERRAWCKSAGATTERMVGVERGESYMQGRRHK